MAKKRKLTEAQALRALENEAVKLLTIIYAQYEDSLTRFEMTPDGIPELLIEYGDGYKIKLTVKAEKVGE